MRTNGITAAAFGVIALAVLLGAMPVAAQGELLSLFTFDESSGNPANSVSGVSGGTLTTNRTDSAMPMYVAGQVGNALQFSRSGAAENWVDCTTGGFPKTGAANGWSTGTISLWIKSGDTTNLGGILGAMNLGSHEAFILTTNNAVGTAANSIRLFVRTNNGSDDNYGLNFPTGSPALDNQWHHLLITWDIASNNSSNGGDAKIYIDGGDALAFTRNAYAASSSSSFNAWTYPVRIGGIGRSDTTADMTGLDGALDDVSVWNERLTATQAKAIYNLAVDSLNYGIADADTLFGIFAAGAGAQGDTSDGKTWQYVTGLSGDAGSVVNHTALILDGSGNGVQIIPEPATMALLAIGGVLTLIRRKRK